MVKMPGCDPGDMGSSPVPHPKPHNSLNSKEVLFDVVDQIEGHWIQGEQRKCTHDNCETCNLRYICYASGGWKVVSRKTWMFLHGNQFTTHGAKLGLAAIPEGCEIF